MACGLIEWFSKNQCCCFRKKNRKLDKPGTSIGYVFDPKNPKIPRKTDDFCNCDYETLLLPVLFKPMPKNGFRCNKCKTYKSETKKGLRAHKMMVHRKGIIRGKTVQSKNQCNEKVTDDDDDEDTPIKPEPTPIIILKRKIWETKKAFYKRQLEAAIEESKILEQKKRYMIKPSSKENV